VCFYTNIGNSRCTCLLYSGKRIHLSAYDGKLMHVVISHWQKTNSTNPKTKGDVLNQIIWHNQFIPLVGKKSALKNSRAFSTTKVAHWCLLKLSCRNTTSRVIFHTITAFRLHATEIENYSRAGMSSTLNRIPTTCTRTAYVQNNLQCISQSLALPSSNCREKTHWTRLYLSRKTIIIINLFTSFSCHKRSKNIRVSTKTSS